MHCPLCQSENNQKELFKTVNAFTSSGKLDKNPTQIKTTITTNDGGGGYCKGNNTITFTSVPYTHLTHPTIG